MEVGGIYQALYRKWRPRRFDEVVGQEAITHALANQISAEKTGHAYLFTGTRGTGKTTCAKIFAKAVNCEDRQGAEPCGKCPLCLGMDDGSILDVAEIDAASNNGVDDVRELREETIYRPSRGKYRVYIIDEVHMLSTAAFNALLKILEEPPDHIIFILATTELHKVPATILSRCQRFDFGRVPAEKIAGRLMYVAEQEQLKLTEGAADLMARLADGSVRDALSLLDTCSGAGEVVDEALVRRMAGVADKGYLFELSGAVQAGDSQKLLETVALLRSGSADMRRLCEELVLHYRNLMLAAAQPDGSLLESVPKEEQQRYVQAAGGIGQARAIEAIRRLARAMDGMGRSPDPRIELELALFDLAEADGGAKPQPAGTGALKPAMPVPAAPANAAPAAAEKAKTTAESTPPAPRDMGGKAVGAEAAGSTAVEGDAKDDSQGDTGVKDKPEETAVSPPAGPEISGGGEAEAVAGTGAGEDGMEVFPHWDEVLARMAEADRMLSAYMKGSRAYVEGKRVLIDGGEMFLTFIRQNDFAKERIKTVIEQVSGRRYGIGPYEAKPAGDAGRQPTAKETLKEWEELGVQITYE